MPAYPFRMASHSPFRHFRTNPEIICLSVAMFVRLAVSLRKVEDLLHQRGIDVVHETVRFWWHGSGPTRTAEARGRRVEGMRSSHWLWHLDEGFVKVNGGQRCLWRAVGHDDEVRDEHSGQEIGIEIPQENIEATSRH